MKTNQEIIEELEKDFPFLFEVMEEITIFGIPFRKRFKDYLLETLEAKDKAHREAMIELLESVPTGEVLEELKDGTKIFKINELLEIWKSKKLTKLNNESF